jgi:hypothetical protein
MTAKHKGGTKGGKGGMYSLDKDCDQNYDEGQEENTGDGA